MESKFANVSIDDLGVFASAIIYPPEKGIFPKFDENKNVPEITNKTIYLSMRNINIDEDSDFENDKNKVDENKNKENMDDVKVRLKKSKTCVKIFNEESSSKSDKKENDSSKEKNSSENENSDNLKNDEKKNSNNDNVVHKWSFESLNNDKNNYVVTDHGSSNNIKKNFDHSFLDDALDKVILNTDSTK